MQGAEHAVDIFLLLILMACGISLLTKLVRLPYTVALVLAGLAVAFVPGMPRFELTPGIVLYIVLPGILFQAGMHLDFEELHKNLKPIALLAIPGVLVSTVVTAGVFHLITGGALPFKYCLLFGALVSPTDPISVLAVLKQMGVPERIRFLMEGESLFNDGTGVVVFRALMAITISQAGDASIAGAALQFVIAFGGSVVLGLVLGYFAYHVHKRINDHLLEVMFTILLAYGSFMLGEHIHLSGVVTCVVAALFMGNYGRLYGMQDVTRKYVNHFWDCIDFILNSVLFLMIGLEIQVVQLNATYAIPVLAGIGAHLVGRAAASYPSTFFLEPDPSPSFVNMFRVRPTRPGSNFKIGHVLFWGGLKGSIPLALVLQLKAEQIPTESYQLLLTMTFSVVLFSLIFQTITMKPLLRALKMHGAQGETREETAKNEPQE
ncbi:MAG: cation:proton antiporter [Planctomycetota bacterium]|jgi:CPA1 family monovalent cation:H+ antiporter